MTGKTIKEKQPVRKQKQLSFTKTIINLGQKLLPLKGHEDIPVDEKGLQTSPFQTANSTHCTRFMLKGPFENNRLTERETRESKEDNAYSHQKLISHHKLIKTLRAPFAGSQIKIR